ncbi:b149.14 [miniopterid betaherpesvirus 1]|uniref:B149.14 n=1 Tax=miniopterid betaherpesvirus 1 TaxID=3070189 RepID=I3VQE6_9BETA|nr:b149.14 [miniopterid betaherpesvirus 1]AFK83990.1 b149.14 [miniopterid betaherpesvirus 1]
MSCLNGGSMRIDLCNGNNTITVTKSLYATIPGITFHKDSKGGVIAIMIFDHSVAGLYRCIHRNRRTKSYTLITNDKLVSTYKHYNGSDTFVCSSPYQKIEIYMEVDGEDVTDRCYKYINGTVTNLVYSAAVIHNASCVAYISCRDSAFHGPTYILHNNNYILHKNGFRSSCSRDKRETFLRIVDERGGEFSDSNNREREGALIHRKARNSPRVFYVWCVTKTKHFVYVSDIFNVTNKPRLLIKDTTARAFVADAVQRSYRVNIYLCIICIILTVYFPSNPDNL